jgi:hypothetical protein
MRRSNFNSAQSALRLTFVDVEFHSDLFARWQGPTARPGTARKIRDAAQGVLENENADIPLGRKASQTKERNGIAKLAVAGVARAGRRS